MIDISDKLVVVSGPSGAGKDTIVRYLLEKDCMFSLAVSATTRAPRGQEVDGVDYYFLTESDFECKVKNGEFIEYAQYGNSYYGTLKSDVENRVADGKTVILVIEVNGAANIKKLYPKAITIFIMPPSLDVLEARLRGRKTETEEAIQRRLRIAESEMQKSKDYDYVVINDVLQTAVDDAYSVVIKAQNKEC